MGGGTLPDLRKWLPLGALAPLSMGGGVQRGVHPCIQGGVAATQEANPRTRGAGERAAPGVPCLFAHPAPLP